jgi:hypothetical protein
MEREAASFGAKTPTLSGRLSGSPVRCMTRSVAGARRTWHRETRPRVLVRVNRGTSPLVRAESLGSGWVAFAITEDDQPTGRSVCRNHAKSAGSERPIVNSWH